jgi:hypothetical protein
MKNTILAFVLALLIVLSGVSIRQRVLGIGTAPMPLPPPVVGIGTAPMPLPPPAVGIGTAPMPLPPPAF